MRPNSIQRMGTEGRGCGSAFPPLSDAATRCARRLAGAWLAFVCGLGCHGAPPADLRVVSAREELVVPRHPAIQGRDGGGSRLAFGRSVWVYGDTVLEQPDERGEQWHTNSFALADVTTWKTRSGEPVDAAGAPRYFVPRTAEETAWDDAHAPERCASPPCHSRWALWPSPPIVDEPAGLAYILYGLYNDHHPSGIGIAVWRGINQTPERQRVGDSWLLFPSPEPEYANAPIIHDGHLYAFGCTGSFERPCALGRAAVEHPAERSAWRFYDGSSWVADYRHAATLFAGQPIMSLSWNAYLQRFLIVYAPPFGHAVQARTAARLEGPWSEEISLFEVPGESTYDANLHPELEEDGGRIQYITYSRHIDRGWFGAEHVAWRVELSRREGE